MAKTSTEEHRTSKKKNLKKSSSTLVQIVTDSFHGYLDVLLCCGDNPLPHEEAVVLEEASVLLRVLLALVQEEADHALLEDVPQFPEETTSSRRRKQRPEPKYTEPAPPQRHTKKILSGVAFLKYDFIFLCGMGC